jgi:hypothetical protein
MPETVMVDWGAADGGATDWEATDWDLDWAWLGGAGASKAIEIKTTMSME